MEYRDSATGRVYMSSVCATTSGHRKLFQDPRKVRMPRVASGGPHRGMTIRRNVRSSPAPSIRAASIRESGMPMMNWRMRNTPIGAARNGRISAG
ncbi:hypothetical protein D9M72_540180 [compost metagenome]